LMVIVIAITSAIIDKVNAGIKVSSVTTVYESIGLPSYESYSWKDVTSYSVGQTVNIYMNKGSLKSINWMKYTLTPYVLAQYNIKVNVNSTLTTPNILSLVESQLASPGGKTTVDMIWMNGANYYRAVTGVGASIPRTTNLLYGPWANKVPSEENFDWTSSPIAFDFGYPNEGYEMPFWSANFVLNYRSDMIPNPPQSFAALVTMCDCTSNPPGILCGKFTYAVPLNNLQNSEAQAFIRNFMYELAGGYQSYLNTYNAPYYYSNIKKAFKGLQQLEGVGKQNLYNVSSVYGPYCPTQAVCDALYSSGKIYMTMSYSATTAGANCVSGGAWATNKVTLADGTSGSLCDNTKSYVPATGAVSNINFFTILKSSPHILPALVVGNYIGSIHAQFSRRTTSGNSAGWIETYSTTCPAITSGGWNVPFDYLAKYQNYPQTAVVAQLRSPYALPEVVADYATQMNYDWVNCVGAKTYSTVSPCPVS